MHAHFWLTTQMFVSSWAQKIRATSKLFFRALKKISAFLQSRRDRQLASQEEKRFYSQPEHQTHWAIPQLDESARVLGYDGGNQSCCWILENEELSLGRALYDHTNLPLRTDPFLTRRYIPHKDSCADLGTGHEHFEVSEARKREIWEEAGLGPLQKFLSQCDYPDWERDYLDWEEDYLIIMSHPDSCGLSKCL